MKNLNRSMLVTVALVALLSPASAVRAQTIVSLGPSNCGACGAVGPGAVVGFAARGEAVYEHVLTTSAVMDDDWVYPYVATAPGMVSLVRPRVHSQLSDKPVF